MKFISLLSLLLLLCQVVADAQDVELRTVHTPIEAVTSSTPFTYQGRLTASGTFAHGSYDFIVILYKESEGGEILDERVVNAVQVTFGTFTIPLDFDSGIFHGADTAFLDIWVRPTGSGEFTQLTPRQQIGSTPYAKVADNAKEASLLNCTNCISDGQIVSLAGGKITGTVANATNAVNAQNAETAVNATNAVTAQNAVNAVDLTSNQTVGGNKNFTGILSGNGAGLTNIAGTLRWNVVSAISTFSQPNQGYVTVNAGMTTVVLPAQANPGDVVKIRAQGDGGFRINQWSGQQILASDIPNNTFVFTPRESNRNWQSITSSADGSKLAAVVSSGQIYTSTNLGVTWTARLTDTNRNWTSITSSADGSKLAAVVFGGQIYTSTDLGVTWMARMTDSNRNWQSITSSADGTRLAAVAWGGHIYTSTNSGVTWMARMTDSNRIWEWITSSADGSKLAAVVNGGQIYTSTDSGVTWMARNSNRQWYSITSSADGSKLAAVVNGGQIYTSTDSGVTWMARDSNRQWYSITSSADGSKLAAVVNGGQIYTSTDSGVTWTPRESNRSWQSITSSADGTKLAAFVGAGQIYTSEMITSALPATTAGAAGYLTGDKFSTIELVYIGNNQFVAVNATGNFTAY